MIKTARLFLLLMLSLKSISVMGQISYDAKTYPVDLFALEHLAYGLLENDSVAPVHYPDGFRYINIHSNKPVINQVFEGAYPFAGNFGLVKLGGKYGVINREGSLVVKPGFDHFQLLNNLNYGFYFNDENFFSLSRGKLIKQPEIVCGEPVAPYSWVFEKGLKYGAIFNKDTLKRHTFDTVFAISDRLAIVKEAGRIKAVDKAGKMILDFGHKEFFGEYIVSFGFVYAIKEKQTWHYYVGTRKLFENKYQPVHSSGVLLVETEVGKYNYLNKTGKLMLHNNYKWIAENGAVAITEDKKLVFLLKDNKELRYY